MSERIKKIRFFILRSFQSKIGHNILALSSIQFINYLFPLLTVPFLTRVLGPTTWGLLSFDQSFALLITLIVEYGFNLSATREVARNRDNADSLADIFAGVMGAKVLLTAICFLSALLLLKIVPHFRAEPRVYWGAIAWAMAQSFNPVWYFQGLERIKIPAALDLSAKIVAAIGLFLWIHSPEDVSRYFLIQWCAAFISTGFSIFLAYRELPFRKPTYKMVKDCLKMGWTMFLFRNVASFYTTANSFILGLVAPVEYVGYFSSAEKISRAILGLLAPFSQSLFPRISYLLRRSQSEAIRWARTSFSVMTAGGLILCIALNLTAPLCVRLVLGSNYLGAIPVLQILALLIPLSAMSNVLGIQWMLPLGLDGVFNRIFILGGIINVILAIILSHLHGHIGVAWAVVFSEAFITGCMFFELNRRRLNFFWKVQAV